MDKEHELTEELKVIETEIYNDKLDLRNVANKLEIAQQYENELIQRQQFARKHTEQLRNEFFQKCTSISEKYEKIKEKVEEMIKEAD